MDKQQQKVALTLLKRVAEIKNKSSILTLPSNFRLHDYDSVAKDIVEFVKTVEE